MCSILWAILGLSYLLFDPIVKHLVLKRLVLRNDSDFAEIWRNPPIKPHFKVSHFLYVDLGFETCLDVVI